MTLSARILVLLLLAIAPVAALEAWNLLDTRTSSLRALEGNAERMLARMSENYEDVLNDTRQLFLAVAETLLVRNGDVAACDEQLGRMLRHYPQYAGLFVTDAVGVVVCSSLPDATGVFLGDQPYVQEALATERLTVGTFERGLGRWADGADTLPIVAPYRADSGAIAGAIGINIRVGWLVSLIGRAHLPPTAQMTIADSDGVVLAQHPGGAQAPGERLSEADTALFTKPGPGVVPGPADRIVAYAPPKDRHGLFLALAVDTTPATHDVDRLFLRSALIVALILVSAVASALIGSRLFIQRPIRALMHATEEWRLGNRTIRVGLRGRSEIAKLGAAFDAMAAYWAREAVRSERSAFEAMQARQEAERAAEAKSKFLAAASHDLRQPVQALCLLSDALGDYISEPEGREIHADLSGGINVLRVLLDSLLDVSRLDADTFRPDFQQVQIGALFAELGNLYTPVAAAKGIRLSIAAVPGRLSTDPDLLGRILRNLLENAVRYTNPGGHIVLRARREDGSLHIEVEDTGIGIPDDHLALIWDEFHQVGNRQCDQGPGLGLGLAIVKRLAKLLDHPVQAHSEPGRGSVFTVTVPLAAPPCARGAALVTERAAIAG